MTMASSLLSNLIMPEIEDRACYPLLQLFSTYLQRILIIADYHSFPQLINLNEMNVSEFVSLLYEWKLVEVADRSMLNETTGDI